MRHSCYNYWTFESIQMNRANWILEHVLYTSKRQISIISAYGLQECCVWLYTVLFQCDYEIPCEMHARLDANVARYERIVDSVFVFGKLGQLYIDTVMVKCVYWSRAETCMFCVLVRVNNAIISLVLLYSTQSSIVHVLYGEVTPSYLL